MLNIFNRKKLLTDSSPEEIARVADLLKRNRVPYELITKRSQSSLEMSFHANIGIKYDHGGGPPIEHSVGPLTFVYHIYVSGKDLAKARELIN